MEAEEGATIPEEEPNAQQETPENVEPQPDVTLKESVQDAAAALLEDSESYTEEEESIAGDTTNSGDNQMNQQDESKEGIENNEIENNQQEEEIKDDEMEAKESSEEKADATQENVNNENNTEIVNNSEKEENSPQNEEQESKSNEDLDRSEENKNFENAETERVLEENGDEPKEASQEAEKAETEAIVSNEKSEENISPENTQEQQPEDANTQENSDTVLSTGLNNVTAALFQEDSEDKSQNEQETQNDQPEPPSFSQTEPLEIHEPYTNQSSGSSSPRELRSPRQSKTSRSPRPKYVIKDHTYHPDPKYSDDYLDKQLKAMLESKKLPADQEMYGPMLRYADHQTLELTNAFKYGEAMKYDEAASMLRSFSDDRAEKERIQAEKDKEKQKLEGAQQMIVDINKKWDDQIGAKRDEFERLRRQLEDKHRQEEADYEALWASPEHMAQYSKPSPQLLSLRSVEEKYATAKLFDLAANARKSADQLAAAEAAEARLRAVEDMRAGYATMKARQERAEECLTQYFDKEISGMEVKREKELYGWKAMVKRIEQPPNTVRTPREAVLYMPRPLRRKAGQQGTQMLNVGTINLRKFVKTQKPATARASKRSNAGK